MGLEIDIHKLSINPSKDLLKSIQKSVSISVRIMLEYSFKIGGKAYADNSADF